MTPKSPTLSTTHDTLAQRSGREHADNLTSPAETEDGSLSLEQDKSLQDTNDIPNTVDSMQMDIDEPSRSEETCDKTENSSSYIRNSKSTELALYSSIAVTSPEEGLSIDREDSLKSSMLISHTASVPEPIPLASSLNSSQVLGPNGQLCEDSKVLERVLQAYTHISSNIFRGGANGRMPTECMMCECRYDPETDSHEVACGAESDCINRALNIECPTDCPCGPFCLNQRYKLI